MMSNRAASLLLLALAAAPAGCKAKASAAVSTEESARPIHVETTEVIDKAMPRSLALTGTLRGERQTDLAANANGRVLETLVERGAEVKKGALIARLDVRAAALSAAEAQANVAVARAQEATATRECERSKALLAKGVISQVEFDKTSDLCRTSPLSVAAAAARVSSVSQGIGDGQIRAPFDGMISERFVEVGEYVRQDSKVVSLVSVDKLRIEFTVPEASLASVKEGGALTFTVTAYPDRSFTGTVRFISAAVRETTRDLVAEAKVENTDRALRPGMFASIALATGEAPSTVVLKDAIVMKDGRARVFAVVDHRLEERVVQTGVEKDGVIAVVRGVRAGDKLVLKPSETLQNGQAVE
jgi:membrane fusion protein, multidrug efflux system